MSINRSNLCVKCHSSVKEFNTKVCANCIYKATIKDNKKLLDETLQNKLFWCNIKIYIKIEIITESHYGYCGEPSINSKKNINVIRINCFLPKFFTREDVNADNTVNMESANFIRLIRDILHITKDKGCGKCGSDYNILKCYTYQFIPVSSLMV